MDTKIKCVECGKVIEKDNSYTYDGNYICEGCFNNGYFICSDCGSVTPVSLSRTVNKGRNDERFVCNSCATAYDVCLNCGDLLSSSAIWANDGYNIICHNCSSEYNICRDCHTIITEDESYYYGDEVYCSSCYDERCQEDLDEYVEEYSYKPEAVFLGTSPDNLYLGVELEVDNGNAYNAAQSIWEASKDVYMKHDGSLNNGFEIVSHPGTYSYHKNNLGWDKIMEICRSNGMKSHDTKTCGLHVHVSRLFFGEDEVEQDLHISKLILIVNKFWESHIVPFSRRELSQLDRWATKPIVDLDENDTEEDVVDKVKNTKQRGRYQGINLANYYTLEWRIFRGTLKLNTFIATLQLVENLCRVAKEITLKDVYRISWSDLFCGKEELYPELFEYMKSKNLI